MKGSATGFTLIQLLIILSSLSILIAVIGAPKRHFDNDRAAALTVSRTYDLLNAAFQYSHVNSGWPYDGECTSANQTSDDVGEGIVGFDGVFLEDGVPVNGWGEEFSFSCEFDANVYDVYQNVPEGLASYFVNYLEQTEVVSTTDGRSLIRSRIDFYGNRSFVSLAMVDYSVEEGGCVNGWVWSGWYWYWGCKYEEPDEIISTPYRATLPKPSCIGDKVPSYNVSSTLFCVARTMNIEAEEWTREPIKMYLEEVESTDVAWVFQLRAEKRNCGIKLTGEPATEAWVCDKYRDHTVETCEGGDTKAELQAVLSCN